MGVKQHIIRNDPIQTRLTGWLTTFNDLITLLMVFFVLLFSMGTMDVKRFKNFQNELQSAMGVMYEGRNAPGGLIGNEQWYVEDKKEAPAESDGQSEDFKALAGNQGLEAEYSRKGIQLTLNDDLLFRSGSARITDSGSELLETISAVIKPLNRPVRIEGHTDDRPIATPRYPSNWELSTARAVNVVKYFAQNGGIPANHLSAAGYGSSKPRVPNDSAGNRGKNRRVEIILGQVLKTQMEKRPIEGE